MGHAVAQLVCLDGYFIYLSLYKGQGAGRKVRRPPAESYDSSPILFLSHHNYDVHIPPQRLWKLNLGG
jgi:hypothetical protein